MGNQQLQINESQSNISQYYQKMLNLNKENIPYQYQKTPKLTRTDSKNKLRPTSKVNLDIKLGSRSSEKYLNGVSQQLFLETPHVSNPLEKLSRKRSSTKIVQENDDSHIQLLELLKNMVRHQDSTMQSSQDKVTEQSCYGEKKKTFQNQQETPLFQEDRPLQFNFSAFNRKRSKTFEESFKTLISNEDRCQPIKSQRKDSQDEQALQFILQNCTQTQSRVDQQRSNSITFESLESDWQAMTKKNSKQLETPGTAQFQGLNKDDKIFELSTSNFVEMNNEDIGSRRPSCVESSFLIPMVLHSQNSLDFDDSKEVKPRMIGIQKPNLINQNLSQIDQTSNYSTRDGSKYQEKKQITKSLAFGLPNKAPFKHKSFHQQSELHLETAKTIIQNIKNNISNIKTNTSFVQNIPQPSFTSKNTKSSCDSIQKSVKLSAYPEEQWLKNSKLEYKKIMLVLDDQQKIQNFSIQNQNEMISNTFTSSEIDTSQRYYQEDVNYKIKPLQEDKNTQTQLKELQKDFIQRLSQPKYKNSSRVQEQNPYWKLREIDSTKRTKRK